MIARIRENEAARKIRKYQKVKQNYQKVSRKTLINYHEALKEELIILRKKLKKQHVIDNLKIIISLLLTLIIMFAVLKVIAYFFF